MIICLIHSKRKNDLDNSFKTVLVCPDDTEPLDSSDGGFSIEIIGAGTTDQDADDAFESYLGTGLEIDDGDSLKLTSTCPSGSGVLLSFMLDVSQINSVNITFISSSGVTTDYMVKCFHSLDKIRHIFMYTKYVFLAADCQPSGWRDTSDFHANVDGCGHDSD